MICVRWLQCRGRCFPFCFRALLSLSKPQREYTAVLAPRGLPLLGCRGRDVERGVVPTFRSALGGLWYICTLEGQREPLPLQLDSPQLLQDHTVRVACERAVPLMCRILAEPEAWLRGSELLSGSVKLLLQVTCV